MSGRNSSEFSTSTRAVCFSWLRTTFICENNTVLEITTILLRAQDVQRQYLMRRSVTGSVLFRRFNTKSLKIPRQNRMVSVCTVTSVEKSLGRNCSIYQEGSGKHFENVSELTHVGPRSPSAKARTCALQILSLFYRRTACISCRLKAGSKTQ